MAIRVIVNPSSGRGRAGGLVPQIQQTLAEIGQAAAIDVARDGPDLAAAVRHF